jgi:hypothetical protein
MQLPLTVIISAVTLTRLELWKSLLASFVRNPRLMVDVVHRITPAVADGAVKQRLAVSGLFSYSCKICRDEADDGRSVNLVPCWNGTRRTSGPARFLLLCSIYAISIRYSEISMPIERIRSGRQGKNRCAPLR